MATTAAHYRKLTGNRHPDEIRTAYKADPRPQIRPLGPEDVDTCGSGSGWPHSCTIGQIPADLGIWSDRE